jgi:hypothetical protein
MPADDMQISAVNETKFSASVARDGADIVVRLAGNADVAAKRHFEPILSTAHDHARQLGVSRVRVDLRQLAFMSSSCFKDLIAWLDKVRESGVGREYQVLFQSSAAHQWQRRSLHALSCFARELVSIEST